MNLLEIHEIKPNRQGAMLEAEDGLPKRREWIFHQEGLARGYAATVALILDESRQVWAGVSLCSPKDTVSPKYFDRRLGRYVALIRARRSMVDGIEPYAVLTEEDVKIPEDGKLNNLTGKLALMSRTIAHRCAQTRVPLGKADRRPPQLKAKLAELYGN